MNISFDFLFSFFVFWLGRSGQGDAEALAAIEWRGRSVVGFLSLVVAGQLGVV